MNILNGSRDRGKNQPVRMTDESSKVYVFNFGEPLAISNPEYEETQDANQTNITIKARTLKEARILLGCMKARHPKFEIDDAMKLAVFAHEWPDGMLHHRFQIGPKVVFPATFVAASIFAGYYEQDSSLQLKNYIENFDPSHPAIEVAPVL